MAERLWELSERGLIPPLKQMGVILAGDLFAHHDKRGGLDDVTHVWARFAELFRWVAGVAGNHDLVALHDLPSNAKLLDCEVAELDGIRIGGVGGVSVGLTSQIDAAPKILPRQLNWRFNSTRSCSSFIRGLTCKN